MQVFSTIFLGCLLAVLVIGQCGIVLSLGIPPVSHENGFVVVRTRESGTYAGIREGDGIGETGNVYYAFRGIPYAKPPVGSLLLMDPEPPEIHAGPKDATRFKSICPQWNSTDRQPIGNQDCLYLNIFTPRLHFNVSRAPNTANIDDMSPFDDDPRNSLRYLPTIVYIHGGNFLTGSGNIENYQGFLEENCVFASINFRLGIFGISNHRLLGIRDQILALRWIKKNIHRFGGDPKRITIYGEVDVLLHSPLTSEGQLFNGAILTSDKFGDMSRIPPSIISLTLGCDQSKIEECLNKSSTEDIIRSQQQVIERLTFPGSMVVSDEQDNVTSGEFKFGVPILTGVNVAEGFRGLLRFDERLRLLSIEEVEANLGSFLKEFFVISESGIREIWNYYFGATPLSGNNSITTTDNFQSQLMKLFGDMTVYNSHTELLRTFQRLQSSATKTSPIFNYVFDYGLESNFKRILETGQKLEFYPWEEEYYLFPEKRALSTEENQISRILLKIWASFASYGTPKNALGKQKTWGKWLNFHPSSQADLPYYHIKLNESRMASNFRKEEYEFWEEILTKYGQEHISMVPTTQHPNTKTELHARATMSSDDVSKNNLGTRSTFASLVLSITFTIIIHSRM